MLYSHHEGITIITYYVALSCHFLGHGNVHNAKIDRFADVMLLFKPK